MSQQYVMRATRAGATVYWVVTGMADMTGVHSGFDPMTLSSIAVDCIVELATATVGGTIQGRAGGDLDGYYAEPIVAKIHGRPVDGALPTEGDVLSWDSDDGYWKPKTGGIGGRPINDSAPKNNEVVTWDEYDGYWKPDSPQLPTKGLLNQAGTMKGNGAVNVSASFQASGYVGAGNKIWVVGADGDAQLFPDVYNNSAGIYAVDVTNPDKPVLASPIITGLFGVNGFPRKVTYDGYHIWVTAQTSNDYNDNGNRILIKIDEPTGKILAVIPVTQCLDVAYDGVDSVWVVGYDPNDSNRSYFDKVNITTHVVTTFLVGDPGGNGDYYNCNQLVAGGGFIWTVAPSVNFNSYSFVVKTDLNGNYVVDGNMGGFSDLSLGALAYDSAFNQIYVAADQNRIAVFDNSLSTRNDYNSVYFYGCRKMIISGNDLYIAVHSEQFVFRTDISGGSPAGQYYNSGNDRNFYGHRDEVVSSFLAGQYDLAVSNGKVWVIDAQDCELRYYTIFNNNSQNTFVRGSNIAAISDYRDINLTKFTIDATPGSYPVRVIGTSTGSFPYKPTYKFVSQQISLLDADTYGSLPALRQRQRAGEGRNRISGALVLTSSARLEPGKTLTTVAGTNPSVIKVDHASQLDGGTNFTPIFVARNGSKDIIKTDLLSNVSPYEPLRDYVVPLFQEPDGYYAGIANGKENAYPVNMCFVPNALVTIDQFGAIYTMNGTGSIVSYTAGNNLGPIVPGQAVYVGLSNYVYTIIPDRYIVYNNVTAGINNQQDAVNAITNSGTPAYPLLSYDGYFKSIDVTTGIFPDTLGSYYAFYIWIGTDNGELLVRDDPGYYTPNPLDQQWSVGIGKTISAIKHVAPNEVPGIVDGYIYCTNMEDGYMNSVDITTAYTNPGVIVNGPSMTPVPGGLLVDFVIADGYGWALFDNLDNTGNLIPFDIVGGTLAALHPTGWDIAGKPVKCDWGPSNVTGEFVIYVTDSLNDSVHICNIGGVAATFNGTSVPYPVGGLLDWV